MSAVVLAGGRVLNVGGGAFSIPASSPISSLNVYKFIPGFYMHTGGYEFGTTYTSGSNYYYQTEINLLATGSTNVAGYTMCLTWWNMEDTTQATNLNNPAAITTQYPGFANINTVYNYLQSKVPGAALIIYLKNTAISPENYTQSVITGTNWGATSGNPITGNVPLLPRYIINCGGTLTMPTSYGAVTTMSGPVAPIYSGSSYYGFGFSGYNANTFSESIPATWNPVVQQAWNQLLQALLQYTLTATAGPYAGQSFTIDNHPGISLVALNDEVSINMTNASNFSSGITVNPPLTTGGAPAASAANFFSNYKAMCAMWSSTSQHTPLAINYSFGFDAATLDGPTTLPGYINNNVNGNGLSALPGICMSTADGEINDWGLNGWQYPQAAPTMQGFIGISPSYTGPSVGPLPSPTYPDLSGVMPYVWQVQAGDYCINSGGSPEPPLGASVAATQQGIIAGANRVKANWATLAVSDAAYFGQNAWTGAITGTANGYTTYWNGQGVYFAIQGQSLSTLLPVNLMAAPAGLQITAQSSTSVSLGWTAQRTYTGTGLTYTVFKNGVSYATGIGIGSPNYTDNAATSGGTYTVAVANTNGTGPQSSQVTATAAVNPMWTNFAAGGGSALSYENFAIFKNRVREGRMYSGTLSPTTGWPSTAFSYVLWEGTTLPSWATAATSSTPFKCGYIGTGTPSVWAGCTVANIVLGNGTTTYTTFDLYNCTGNFGFSSSAAATNVFAYLPEYPAETIDNPTTAAAFRTEAINFYKQFAGLRWMWWSNVTQNTGENTSATRNTPSNTQFAKGWGGNYSQNTVAEGFPLEWAAAFCAACNIGIYYTLPVWEDGTDNAAGTYTTAALGVLNSVSLPTGQPIRLEIGNELWNGAYPASTTLQTLAAANGFPNTSDGAMQYLGYKLHALANACRTTFGGAFGTQVKLVFASQAGGNGWGNFFPAALSYMQTNYGAPGNDVKILSIAPYMNLANNAGDTSVALVLSDLNTVGAAQPYTAGSGSEHTSILAQHYGMELAAYEAGWQTNSEPSGNAYIASAIMNSGMVATMEIYWTAMLNAGYREINNFDSGAANGGGAYTPIDEFTTSDANIQSAPRVTAILNFATGSYSQTRNAIGPGGSITGGNFADTINGTLASLTVDATMIANYSAACQFYWTGPAGTRSLVINVTGNGTTYLEMAGTTVVSGASLVTGNNTFSVPVQAGFNYLLIGGNGSYQNVTINSVTVN